MIPWVIKAEYINDYRVQLFFNDGAQGEIDFSGELDEELLKTVTGSLIASCWVLILCSSSAVYGKR